MGKLHKLKVQGFKSIRDQEFEFGPLNVFIGGNGAGKSNLVGVFYFLHRVAGQQLQNYTGEAGGANTILHFGRKKTQRLRLMAEFREGTDANIYDFTLAPTDEDRFIFEREAPYYWDTARFDSGVAKDVWSGHAEARIKDHQSRISRYVRSHLDSYRIYHFHDTSVSAPPKQTCDVDDNRFLRADAANLAAFLYLLQQKQPVAYQNVEDTIQQVAPFFGRFKLAPSALNPGKIRLEWEEEGSDTYFGAAALSDGTLRFICLATLLLQPTLPSLILIDEPELGLHPAAIQVLAGLLRSASTHTQLIVATQSVTLINQLYPEQVWVVDREGGASTFKHLKGNDMSSWMDDYGLGELWEKNIIGGRP